MSAKQIKVWSWRDAILKAKLESNTKLVLLTISVHMSELGKGAFPSYKLLAAETGLDRSSVIRHSRKAVEAGFLEKERAFRENGSATSNRYAACFPSWAVVVGTAVDDAPAAAMQAVESAVTIDTPASHMPPGGSGTMPPGGSGTMPPGGSGTMPPGVVAPCHPHNTSSSNTNLLTSFSNAPSTPPPHEPRAIGKEEQAKAQAADVKAMLLAIPAQFRFFRVGMMVSETGKARAKDVIEQLRSAVTPAARDDLEQLVSELRAAGFSRPDWPKLAEQFREHGWQMALSGFPLWAVSEGFALCRANGRTSRPRASQIALGCAQAVRPLNAAIFACNRYLTQPLPQEYRPPTEEDKAAVTQMMAEVREKLGHHAKPRAPP